MTSKNPLRLIDLLMFFVETITLILGLFYVQYLFNDGLKLRIETVPESMYYMLIVDFVAVVYCAVFCLLVLFLEKLWVSIKETNKTLDAIVEINMNRRMSMQLVRKGG